MADPHPPTDAATHTAHTRPAEASGPTGGMPRWVKVSLIALLVVVLLFGVGKLTGIGGDHGPGRHGGETTPSSVVDEGGGHRPPVDHVP